MRCIFSRPAILLSVVLCAGLIASTASFGLPMAFQQPTSTPAKTVGTIKAITGNTITLTPDSGAEITIQVDPAARIVRVEPGQKDLKNATLIQVSDLQPGDRIVVRGKPTEDGKAIVASVIMAMKQGDLAAKQQSDREDWQRRGTGGLVTAVDPAAGTITISSTTFAGKKTTLVRLSKVTIIRRYAPDSVEFDDAKPASLDQIKTGDQLRARGTRSEDGTELNADEVVAGTFRNIAGTVISADAAANTANIMDAITKKPIVVKFSAGSQLRKLPPEMAQRIAMRLKGEASANGGPGTGAAAPASAGTGQFGRMGGPGGAGFQRRNGGPPDFQQIVNRAPQIGLGDLQKGDAVMILSTEGTDAGGVTAIQVVSGVEPILAATPKGGQPMVLSPWSLGGGGGEETQ